MQVLHVCSEMFPLLKTGGLADVIGALPAAQIARRRGYPRAAAGVSGYPPRDYRRAGCYPPGYLCRAHHPCCSAILTASVSI